MPKFLTKEELEILLKVKTTPKEARQIIKRNKTVLNWIRKNNGVNGVSRFWSISCPHCKRDPKVSTFQCNQCAYGIVNPNNYMPCTYMTFGGFHYQQLTICRTIQLGSSYIWYKPSHNTTPKDIHAINIWLQGHIEWAEEVIRLAKPSPKRKPRSKKPKKKSKKCTWCDGTGKEWDYYKTYPCTHCQGTGKSE